MNDNFAVFVTRDDRLPERGYDMGLSSLQNDPEIDVTFLPPRDYHELRTADLRGANGVVSLKDNITAETLAGLDSLEIIGRFGSGFDNVDIDACTERGIVVTNAPQGLRESVAQATVGMLIVCASHMRKYDNVVRSIGFDERLDHMGVELFDKTLGLIGSGQIGSRVLQLLEPFDMDVLTYDPYLSAERADELGVERVELSTLLARSDFVSLHCPLTEETEGMLGEAEFEHMNDDAYFVNTTRGGIYADEVLATALRENWIAGAAIDVFENEPHVEGNPLLDIEDCLVMPHAAGINKDGLTRVGEIVSDSIIAHKNGEIPANVLNPDAYDRPVPEDRLSPSYR